MIISTQKQGLSLYAIAFGGTHRIITGLYFSYSKQHIVGIVNAIVTIHPILLDP